MLRIHGWGNHGEGGDDKVRIDFWALSPKTPDQNTEISLFILPLKLFVLCAIRIFQIIESELLMLTKSNIY